MIVRDIEVVERRGGAALKATVQPESAGTAAFELEYFVRQGRPEWLAATGDPFVAPLLQLAMARHEGLRVEGRVSPRLLRSVPTIMDIYQAWKPGLARVEVVAPDGAVPHAAGTACGLFFSGGVDSFYSLLKNDEASRSDERITHLVLVFGFDVRLHNPTLFEQIAARAAEVAQRAAKQLVVVETNVRSLSDPIASWDLYHGGPMAGVGLALGGLLHRVVVASSYAYQDLHPWGSHPLLDSCWSNEGVEFVHDGCEATRLQKVRRISTSEIALASLRVCWENEDTQYNCGRCEKCVRTMLALHVAGALDRCSTFAQPLSTQAVRRITVGSENGAIFLRELLSTVEASSRDADLAAALRGVIRAGRRRARIGKFLRDHVGPWTTLPGGRRAFHRTGKAQVRPA